MQCPSCQHQMIASGSGFLCLECGHLEKPSNVAINQTSAAVAEDVAFTPPQPVASAPTSTDSNIGMVSATAAKRHSLLVPLMVTVAVLVVLGGGGAYAYQAFVMAPKTVLASYLGKLVEAKTGHFSATATMVDDTTAKDATKITLTGSGQYDVTNADNPKIDLSLTGKYGQYGLGGEIRSLDKTLYFKVDSLDVLSGYGISLGKDWYKVAMDDTPVKSKCYNQTSSKSGSFLGTQVMTNLPLKDTKLVSLSEKVDGQTTRHYSGALDTAKIKQYVDDANKDLSADCKVTISEDDYKTTTATYDLWTGSDFDRLTVHATDSKGHSTADVTIDSSQYDQAVNITAPAGAKDINTIFGDASSTTASSNQSIASRGGLGLLQNLSAPASVLSSPLIPVSRKHKTAKPQPIRAW